MIRRPPISPRTDTLFPYTTLFRSAILRCAASLLPQCQPLSGNTSFRLLPPSPLRRCPGRDWVPHRPSAIRRERSPIEPRPKRSEEHTSELQSLMRISYAVFCLKKKNTNKHITKNH